MEALAKVFRNRQCCGRVRLSSIFWLPSSALPRNLPDVLPRSVGRLTGTFISSHLIFRVDCDRFGSLSHLFPEVADSLAHGFGGGNRMSARDVMPGSLAASTYVARCRSERVSPAHIQMGQSVLIQSARGGQLFMRLKGANRTPC